MLKRTFAALAGAVVAALPVAAFADPVSIGNLVDKSLNFSLSCAGAAQWHSFRLASRQYKEYAYDDWGERCNTESYDLRITTNNDDGSTSTKIIRVNGGDEYALVHSGNQNLFTAYNVDSLVVVANTSSRSLTFTRGCQGDRMRSITVEPDSFKWFTREPGETCSRYEIAVATTASDESTTSITRNVRFGQLYEFTWNGQRQAWDVREQHQGRSQ